MQMQFMLCQISLRDWSLQRLQHVKEQIKFFQQRGSTEKRFREKGPLDKLVAIPYKKWPRYML